MVARSLGPTWSGSKKSIKIEQAAPQFGHILLMQLFDINQMRNSLVSHQTSVIIVRLNNNCRVCGTQMAVLRSPRIV